MSERQDERRGQPRREVSILAEIDSDDSGESAVGVLRELSLSGGRFLTNSRFEKGESLHLGVHIDPKDLTKVGTIRCSVVRCTPVEATRADVWRHEIAVQFEEGVEAISEELEQLAEHLRAD